MADLINEVRELQRLVGNLPARYGSFPSKDQLVVVLTSGGPTAENSNTYTGTLQSSVSYDKTIGQQDLDATDTGTEVYVFNLGNGFIPDGTYILCEYFNWQLYTWIDGPEAYANGQTMTFDGDLIDALSGVTITMPYGSPNSSAVSVGLDTAWTINRASGDE